MVLKNGQEQGRDEKTKDDYATSAAYFFADVGYSSYVLSSLPGYVSVLFSG